LIRREPRPARVASRSPWARTFAYVWPHRRQFLVAIGQIIVISGLELLKPWPLKVIIDSVLGGAPLPFAWSGEWSPSVLLGASCLALVLLYVLIAGLTIANNYTGIRLGQRMVSDLRGELYGHLHRLSLGFHGRRPVGDLIYRVTADTFAIQTLTTNCVLPLVSACILLGGMAVVMARLDWRLTILALGVCPALLLLIARLNTRMSAAATHARQHESEVYSVVQRAMSAIRVIQAFSSEEREHRRFMDTSERSLAASLHLYTLQTVYSGAVNLTIAAGTALVIWVGARHAMEGQLSVGELVVFVSYLASLYGPINSLFQVWGVVQAGKAGVTRVFDILDVERDIPDGHRVFPAEGATGTVAWDDVSFGYGSDRAVLKNVTLHVRAGEKVAIVGATGAGKSTLVSLLPRFFDTWSGRVSLDGVDVREYQVASLRRQIAMVLQPPIIFPTTIRENIAFGRPDASDEEIQEAARLACLDTSIARMPDGYDTVVAEQGASLSEGEKQRVTIARALLRDSPILILDEPTSALDSDTEATIMRALDRLTAGRTTLIIAHRLSTVRRADRIVVMRDGSVLEQGTFDELIEQRGVFASLYFAQSGRWGGEEAAESFWRRE
jgi:ATP-binding cassette subfamily B protein